MIYPWANQSAYREHHMGRKKTFSECFSGKIEQVDSLGSRFHECRHCLSANTSQSTAPICRHQEHNVKPIQAMDCVFNPLTPGIVSWQPTPRISASLGHTGPLPNRSFLVCGLACRARLALYGEKAHCSVACGSIHASTFLWPGLQMGPIVKLVIFMQIWPFHFLTTHKGQSPYIQEPG